MPDATDYESFKEEGDESIDREERRNADFKACPILADYLATMLQDLQYREADEACMEGREERDTGTIYTLSESEYQKHKADCERFYSENLADIEAAGDLVPGEDGLQYTQTRYMTPERIGSTFYMLRVGHGIAFTDDGDADCLERLNEATRAFSHFDSMIADDGEVYSM
jgi:hypothetical protein